MALALPWGLLAESVPCSETFLKRPSLLCLVDRYDQERTNHLDLFQCIERK